MAQHSPSEPPRLSQANYTPNTPQLGGKRGHRLRPLSADRVGWYGILRRAGNQQATPRLINTLRNGEPDARWQAASSLGYLRDEQATHALVDALHDDNARVRAAVTRSLGRQRDPLLLPNLLDASRDEDPVVREAAARALGSLGSESHEEAIRAQAATRLGALLHDHDQSTRQAAAAMLGWLGGFEASLELTTALFSQNMEVRSNAATVIQWLRTAPEPNRPFARMSGGLNNLRRSALPLVELLVGQAVPSMRLVLYASITLGVLSLIGSSLITLQRPSEQHLFLQILTGIDVVLVMLLPPVAGWLAGYITQQEVRSRRYQLLRRTLLSRMQLSWSYVLTALHRLRIVYGLMFGLMPLSAVLWLQASLNTGQAYSAAIATSLTWILLVVNALSLSVMAGAISSSMMLWQHARHQAVGVLLIIIFLQVNMGMLIVAPQLMFPQANNLMVIRLAVMVLPYLFGGWFIYLARKRA